MKFQNASTVNVYYIRGLEKLPMGQLVLKERKIFFEYRLDFLKTGLQLSPFNLPLKPGVITCEDRTFEGLLGIFNDSLPDGWGRLLLDRKLMQLGINPGELSPLDRLAYVGKHGMGALMYEPEISMESAHLHQDLDEIANEALQFQENDDDRFIDDLLAMNSSSAGARPKIMLSVDTEDWIVKFPSFLDPKDIGSIEYAYHLMAKAAHLNVPEAKLFPSKKGFGYFGVKRFDRHEGKRLHIHSASGLLQVDHRIPSLDYETIMKVTLFLIHDKQACENQFKAAAFNVLTHNRDDHAKNFSFLMDEKGLWQASPAYDLTFSTGIAGEHCTMVMGEGKNPTSSHLLKLAAVGGIKQQEALQIIDQIKMITSKWQNFAEDAGVSKASSTRIHKTLNSCLKL